MTEVDDLGIERMRADNSELEAMWEDVLRVMREARKPYRENDSGSCVKPGALCPCCGEIETSQANSGHLFSHRLPMVMQMAGFRNDSSAPHSNHAKDGRIISVSNFCHSM